MAFQSQKSCFFDFQILDFFHVAGLLKITESVNGK